MWLEQNFNIVISEPPRVGRRFQPAGVYFAVINNDFPTTQLDGVVFFNPINMLYIGISIIITSNKSPKQWIEALRDEVLITALLNRILHIKLSPKCYRIENRKTKFAAKEN